MLLEVIVQTLEDARAARRGGADRLEVVREIERDGLTPDLDLVRAIALETGLPLRVMVRESEGFTVKSREELGTLQRAFEACARLGVDGAVAGYARDGELDLETTIAIRSTAPELRVTFHRAFDAAADPARAITRLQELAQVDRILTTGGTGSWTSRCRTLTEYGRLAGDRPIVLAGGGVDEEGLRMLAAARCVREAHVGKAAGEPQITGAPVSAASVRRLKSLIRST